MRFTPPSRDAASRGSQGEAAASAEHERCR